MRARTVTPVELFGPAVRYVVPIFQRAYVWSRADQWEPLWQDVRVLAEQVLPTVAAGHATRDVSPHFLGAIVLDTSPVRSRSGEVWHVVDGQQRLITVQVLLHAVETVARRAGREHAAAELRALIRNADWSGEREFKVWPGRADRGDLRTALSGVPRPAERTQAGRIVLAHAYFVGEIAEWSAAGRSLDDQARRLDALAIALMDHLKVVVIALEPEDNAQVVFESLNHRGESLTAADLIKNLVFQLAAAQELSVEPLYQKYWQRLDATYWTEHPGEEGARPRIDTFIRRWLVVRTERDVPVDHIVPAFRRYLTSRDDRVEEVLADLAADAKVFAGLDRESAGSEVDYFRYRVLDVLDLESMAPLLLLLMRWRAEGLPPEQFSRALAAIESWAVRRGLVGVKNSNTLQLVLRLVRQLTAGDRDRAGEITEAFLAGLKGQDVWPGDAWVRRELMSLRPAKILPAKRARMLLEAVEDRWRADQGRKRICPRDLTVEHVMPIRWSQYWPLTPGIDTSRRNRHVALLGNLTLVALGIQRELANLPWTDAQAKAARPGRLGKRSQLMKTSLLLNEALAAQHRTEWTEATIQARTAALVDLAVRIWPGPGGDVPVEVEYEEPPATPIDADYTGLTRFLRRKRAATADVALAEFEEALGFALPDEARTDPASWVSETSGFAVAVIAGGYEVHETHLDDGYLTLRKRAKDGTPVPVAGVAKKVRDQRRRGPRKRP